ncbi:hypothetical protein L226DRAFT_532892 [Lentinus tigrinus ALCF2SS1-7]|uniref:uncharacterized protein n=1 Tax=Lentinus tigrinus ALCF2SS1-7 TaxID=1328758 RepID=UPI001166060D|nr:hypothetical protein L226DRAFT_532892 [Lentinus tigrinus ALCF2SS1-7]
MNDSPQTASIIGTTVVRHEKLLHFAMPFSTVVRTHEHIVARHPWTLRESAIRTIGRTTSAGEIQLARAAVNARAPVRSVDHTT